MITLLTEKQKRNLSKWSYSVDDPSITTKLLTPYWNKVAGYVPEYVSPNVLSLAGLLLTVYAYYITYLYSSFYPRCVALVCAILLFGYQTLDAIDGKHARKIKNDSPLGELFDHACDSVGTLFVILTVATTVGITSSAILFYITQGGLMLFLSEHLKAFRTKKVTFFKYTGPGEILLVCMTILIWKFVTGWSLIPEVILHSSLFSVVFFGLYWLIYVYSLVYTAVGIDLNNFDEKKLSIGYVIGLWKKDPHYGTKVGVLLCLAMRHINGILLWYGLIPSWDLQDVIAHGLVLSVVISDLIVAKMARRELHPVIVIASMLSVFNHNLMIYILVGVYFIKMFREICDGLGLPLLTPVVNVYASGVWDLLHLGHMKHFDQISNLGNRLLIGVHDDKDVESYKRTPTLTMEERATTASYCKGVSGVIRSAPLILTEEFIREHNIHKVVSSVEYDSPDDEYYRVPREMGILHIINRVPGVSTSGIMERVRKNSSETIPKSIPKGDHTTDGSGDHTDNSNDHSDDSNDHTTDGSSDHTDGFSDDYSGNQHTKENSDSTD